MRFYQFFYGKLFEINVLMRLYHQKSILCGFEKVVFKNMIFCYDFLDYIVWVWTELYSILYNFHKKN